MRAAVAAAGGHRAGRYNIYDHGISVSTLMDFERCPQIVEWKGQGWGRLVDKFPLVFGSIAHEALELTLKLQQKEKWRTPPTRKVVQKILTGIEERWRKSHSRADAESLQQLEISMGLSESLIPAYFEYWWEDFSKRVTWEAMEERFEIPWTLPDGKKTYIVGVNDARFRRGKKERWLLETKTKGRIAEESVSDTLPMQLQPKMYLWGMEKKHGERPAGVLWNVLRRPGERQGKGETVKSFIERVGEKIAKDPDHYFKRFELPWMKNDSAAYEAELTLRINHFYSWWLGEFPHYRHRTQCEGMFGACDWLPACLGNMRAYRMTRRYTDGPTVEEIEE